MKSEQKKLFLLQFASVFTLIMPLTILFLVKRNYYIQKITPWHLTIGGITCLVFACLMVADKIKINGRTMKFFIVFCFCYLFEPFLADLKMISFMAFLGQFTDSIFFERKIEYIKKKLDAEIKADVFVQKMGELKDGKSDCL